MRKKIDKFFENAIPIIGLIILYFVFTFIAADPNPLHWILFTTVPGRFATVIITGIYLRITFDYYSEK
jgi:hypothetical protein